MGQTRPAMRLTMACFLFLLLSQVLASEEKPSRVGKLFWESTASTTSTLSTTTQCFVVSQAGALIACTQGRKKRSLSLDEAEDCDCEISASKSSNAFEDVLEGEEEDVQPGIEGTPNRQARFVLYWKTTTSTSTATSYTATSTLASLSC